MYDYLFKILLIGDSGVGKSSTMIQYCDNIFNDNHISTIGVDFKIRTIEVDSKTIKLQIWDTAGQERFRNITSSYYRGAHAIILMYDITNLETFQNLKYWYEEIKNNVNNNNTYIILVGNKSDLPRTVDFMDAQEFANEIGIRLFEISAKKSTNLDKIFIQISSTLVNRMSLLPKQAESILHEKNENNPCMFC